VILFIFPVQMETPRHREVKQLAPSLTAWTGEMGYLDPNNTGSMVLITGNISFPAFPTSVLASFTQFYWGQRSIASRQQTSLTICAKMKPFASWRGTDIWKGTQILLPEFQYQLCHLPAMHLQPRPKPLWTSVSSSTNGSITAIPHGTQKRTLCAKTECLFATRDGPWLTMVWLNAFSTSQWRESKPIQPFCFSPSVQRSINSTRQSSLCCEAALRLMTSPKCRLI
jgi:hypothetical protein